jgi:hypothetical protein
LAPVRLFTIHTPLLDADIWWHWRVGQWILAFHRFPHAGLFSQYGATHAWRAYSWGFEVMLAAVFARFGLLGIPIFFILVELALALALFCALRAVSGSFWCAVFLGAAALTAIDPNLVARPMLFSIVLFTAEMGILFRASQTGNRRLLYWLPPLFLLWANFHIQFVYGLFPLLLFALMQTAGGWARRSGIAWPWPPEGISRQALWGVSGLSLLATLVNPYAAGLYRVVWIYAHNHIALAFISEMHANNFRKSAHYVELLLTLAAFYLLGRRRGADPFKLVFLAAASVVAYRTARDAWYIAIPAALAIADSIRALRQERGGPDEADTGRISALQLAAIALGIAGILTLRGLDSGFSKAAAIKTIEGVYPLRAVRFLRQQHPPGPLYNSFNEGGFLIGNLPEYPVSIDGRADLYPDDFLEQYLSVAAAGAGWQDDPALQRANLVMLEPYLPLARELQRDPQFQVVYADEQAVVFTRKR